MMTVKMHLKIVILKRDARYYRIDLTDFHLNTPMEWPEYMQMKLKYLLQEFVDMYDLTKIAEDDGNVYIRIQKGMYGLPEAGILTQQQLEQQLNRHGYHQSPLTPGLWRHTMPPISFTICIDNFGVKYVGHKHAEHLLQVLNAHYKCTID